MPLFIIVIISYIAYFYLLGKLDKAPGGWAYIGALVGVPIFVIIVAYILNAMGLYMDLDNDPGECVKWNWATGECTKTIIP